jgi:hypothetical protein
MREPAATWREHGALHAKRLRQAGGNQARVFLSVQIPMRQRSPQSPVKNPALADPPSGSQGAVAVSFETGLSSLLEAPIPKEHRF